MTSITLLLWIVFGILLQLVIYLSIVYWRHWKNYQALPTHGDDPNPKIAEDKFNSIEKGNLTERLAFQSFKVDRKVFENTSGSICSFYLKPEHGNPLPTFLPGQFLTFRLNIYPLRPTAPNKSFVVTPYRMHLALTITVYQSNGNSQDPVEMYTRVLHRNTFTITSMSAVPCKCEHRADIFIPIIVKIP